LSEHTYNDGEPVIIYADKVGPKANKHEIYHYYTLPFCTPEDWNESPFEGLGEAIQGYELVESKMLMGFKQDVKQTVVCEKTLTKETADAFEHAVMNEYLYYLYIDDLYLMGIVGEFVEEAPDDNHLFIYTHKKFTLSYNDNQVIYANMTVENPMPIKVGQKISFTYEVKWHATDDLFKDRFHIYKDVIFDHSIHWFSIFNSFMMVIFLTGLVSMILMRTLRKDYARFARDDDEDGEVGDESGWKQIHGDVFRAPPHLTLFSALIGTGHQICILNFSVIIFSIIGTYYESRGTVVTAFILTYAFTSFVAGYSGGGYYARNGGKNWIRAMVVTATAFPGIVSATAFLLNFVAIYYGSLSYIPIPAMIAVIVIWALIAVPLTLVGTLTGRNISKANEAPRVNPVPRRIPEREWYLQPWVNVVLGGILPFGSIFIEMYFIFTSFWHHKYYYVYGFLLIVYTILIIVTICVTIVSTYFLLNSEDYRWQWTGFLSGASTAVYVYLYCIYYFFAKTHMHGMLQTVYYFGYMFLMSLGLAILCGSLGFAGSAIFVKRIYSNVKFD